jgi:hypothetical protein
MQAFYTDRDARRRPSTSSTRAAQPQPEGDLKILTGVRDTEFERKARFDLQHPL